MSMVLYKFVTIVNVVFKSQIQWPCSEDLLRVMEGFKDWCGLPFVQGVINYTQIHIQKRKATFVAKLFSCKSKTYIM